MLLKPGVVFLQFALEGGGAHGEGLGGLFQARRLAHLFQQVVVEAVGEALRKTKLFDLPHGFQAGDLAGGG
ncbi:hypothetical protein D3C84_1210180 [compost metagenome]